MIDVAHNQLDLGGLVDADLDTFVTALYVKIDDALGRDPRLRPWRPAMGIAPPIERLGTVDTGESARESWRLWPALSLVEPGRWNSCRRHWSTSSFELGESNGSSRRTPHAADETARA